MKIDLHIHSTASDGKMGPEELVDWAIEKGLKGVAISDHEVVEGSLQAIEYAKDKDIEVVSGIEIGADDEELGIYDVHIVGLFLDLENKELGKLSERLMRAREVQKKKMIVKLKELGYDVTFEELKKEAGGINYGRPHLARILVRKYEEFRNVGDVFDKLLKNDGVANVRQEKESIENTIKVIHGAGGVAILAHPMIYSNINGAVDRFIECGGDGIEVDYFYESRNNYEEAEKLRIKAREIAKARGLIISSGGDFHSKEDGFDIGDYGVDKEEFLKLKEYWRRKRV